MNIWICLPSEWSIALFKISPIVYSKISMAGLVVPVKKGRISLGQTVSSCKLSFLYVLPSVCSTKAYLFVSGSLGIMSFSFRVLR